LISATGRRASTARFALTMHQFLPYAWFGGRCVPFAEATLSVATHALHYGTGAFGGMRALPNPSDPAEILLFRADRHIRRLSQSARLLLTELPEETIHDAIVTFLRANKPTCPVYLRPFVFSSTDWSWATTSPLRV
jgi:branched-chain amino acid aminotransferase